MPELLVTSLTLDPLELLEILENDSYELGNEDWKLKDSQFDESKS